ncbi:hypothetical protein [Streptomyces sp. NPDC088727]|uniref:hypothetical protein n=1 Tax=Streptomyces sp. NPDC088727 TaxID=3365875 RepID=UPI00382E24F9
MSNRYTCRTHGTEERTFGDLALFVCGHDGTLHHCCKPRLAPHGTPRPVDWPAHLAWDTMPEPSAAMLDAMRDADARPHGEFPRTGVSAPVVQGLIDRRFAARRSVGEMYGGPLSTDTTVRVFLTDEGRARLAQERP